MDIKVYKKEIVNYGSEEMPVFVPDVIDIIPHIVESESTNDIRNGTWTLEQLKKIADVSVVDGKLVINSEHVTYSDGNIYITLTEDQLFGCDILEDGSKELLEQECALATIFQRGLDPLDLQDGIEWSEALLGEVNVIQLMEEISEAVSKVTTSVTVIFDTVTDSEGKSYLTYKLQEVA